MGKEKLKISITRLAGQRGLDKSIKYYVSSIKYRMVNLSIIILNYKTKDLTTNCIRSLVKQYTKELEGEKLEAIIVDNASSDDSVKSIKYYVSSIKYNSIRIIENRENVGFAKGCNIGAKNARGKYLLFLNSDTEVLDGGFLRMVKFLDENEHVGILGGKLLNKDGSPQPSCGKFYNLFNLFLMLMGFERFGILRTSSNKMQKVDWVSGGCMMIKKSFFEKLNMFDEKFFMYIEDMELCYRAKRLGLLTYFYPNVKVLHKTLGSSNRAFAIINIYKGLLHFYSKHKNGLQYLIAKLMLIIKARGVIFWGLVVNDKALVNTYTRAVRF